MNIQTHLETLSVEIGARPVGSDANRAAEEYIARVFERAGRRVERQVFPCFDWQLGKTELRVNGASLPACANPYTLLCDVTAPLVFARTREELERAEFQNKILVLSDELAREAYFPKNFRFVTIAEQQEILARLERRKPAAIIAVSPHEKNPAPIFEDGDFEIPSVTVAADVGATLLQHRDARVSLHIDATRKTARGANVIATSKTHARKKIVLCAHFDTKPDTPGALDNAAGVSALLASAQTLDTKNLPFAVEWIAFNGEDYYSAAGQVLYLDARGSEFENIALAINMDGIGWRESRNSIAFFNCPREFENAVTTNLSEIARVGPWYQGDHSLFAMQGIPCLAFSSEGAEVLIDTVIHTQDDTPAIVNVSLVAQVVDAIAAILNGDVMDALDAARDVSAA
jgi:aminopeptidase YwaD